VYSTVEAAELAGVSKNTLLRWIAEGRLDDVARDWRNWRVWGSGDVARARALRDQLHGASAGLADDAARDTAKSRVMPAYHADLTALGQGRAFRRGRHRPHHSKPVGLPAYADELSGLDHGRRYRAEAEVRHAG
jgi:excisionase family DNA binding protein